MATVRFHPYSRPSHLQSPRDCKLVCLKIHDGLVNIFQLLKSYFAKDVGLLILQYSCGVTNLQSHFQLTISKLADALRWDWYLPHNPRKLIGKYLPGTKVCCFFSVYFKVFFFHNNLLGVGRTALRNSKDFWQAQGYNPRSLQDDMAFENAEMDGQSKSTN